MIIDQPSTSLLSFPSRRARMLDVPSPVSCLTDLHMDDPADPVRAIQRV